MASSMKPGDREYPVVYFRSDTTGEKDFEEFWVEGESRDMERFSSLGVILPGERRPKAEVENFLVRLQEVFDRPDFTKAEVVECLREFLPNFEHEEKGRNLDQKM